jgi:hypothetical protein
MSIDDFRAACKRYGVHCPKAFKSKLVMTATVACLHFTLLKRDLPSVVEMRKALKSEYEDKIAHAGATMVRNLWHMANPCLAELKAALEELGCEVGA